MNNQSESNNDWPRLEKPDGWYKNIMMRLKLHQDRQGRIVLAPRTAFTPMAMIVLSIVGVGGLALLGFLIWYALKQGDPKFVALIALITVLTICGASALPYLMRRFERKAGPVLRYKPMDNEFDKGDCVEIDKVISGL